MVRENIARSAVPSEPGRLDVSQVFKKHRRQIERWASRLGGPLVDSDVVVQDGFMVVHRRLPELRADAALTRWLYKITENVATRRRQRERLRRWIRGMSRDYTEDVAAPGHSTLDEIEQREET